LKNNGISGTAPNGATAGIDYQVTCLWEKGINGSNVGVAVVDNGLDVAHEDLSGNVLNGYSWDFMANSALPVPTTNTHGTMVAGTIAAANNNKGGIGVAPTANLMGFNVLTGNQTEVGFANAMVGYVSGSAIDRFAAIAVSNNSWGTPVMGQLDPGFSSVFEDALKKGTTDGRGGKGIVYLVAASNFGTISNGVSLYTMSNSNYHGGLQASPFMLAVGGVNANGQSTFYAERGANVLISGLTAGQTSPITSPNSYGPGIVTSTVSGKGTDASRNYVKTFNGTSAATPGVAGVVALMLQANPNLTWRQVRWILASTATKNDRYNSEWLASAIGPGFNHNYGFGLANASAAVDMAINNPPVMGQMKSCEVVGVSTSAGQIIKNSATVSYTFSTASCTQLSKVEFVEIPFEITTSNFGDFNVELTSPTGAVSKLVEPHICVSEVNGSFRIDPASCDYSAIPSGLNIFTFGSVRHLGENLTGTWKLEARSPGSSSWEVGTAKLVFWGF
jgi:kexin